MKNAFILICLILLVGCKGKEGPSGPQGNQGSPGTPGPTVYTTTFLEGVLPYSGYTGTLMNTVDAANVNTASTNGGTLNFAGTLAGVTRIIIRWPISGFIPSNATVVGASVQLVVGTESITTNKIVGVHSMVPSSPCLWDNTATWNASYTGIGWGSCIGGGSISITKGRDYVAIPSGSVTISSTVASGTSFGWTLTPSTVQSWITTPANNNGIVFDSVNEGTGESVGGLVFGNPTSANAFKPQLVVQYTL